MIYLSQILIMFGGMMGFISCVLLVLTTRKKIRRSGKEWQQLQDQRKTADALWNRIVVKKEGTSCQSKE